MPKNVTVIIILILTLALLFVGWQYLSTRSQLIEAREGLKYLDEYLDLNNFAGMFVKEVLMAEGEISFDTRLKLETAVRELGNENILIAWQKFIESQTEWEAQNATKELLNAFIEEMRKVYEIN